LIDALDPAIRETGAAEKETFKGPENDRKESAFLIDGGMKGGTERAIIMTDGVRAVS